MLYAENGFIVQQNNRKVESTEALPLETKSILSLAEQARQAKINTYSVREDMANHILQYKNMQSKHTT